MQNLDIKQETFPDIAEILIKPSPLDPFDTPVKDIVKVELPNEFDPTNEPETSVYEEIFTINEPTTVSDNLWKSLESPSMDLLKMPSFSDVKLRYQTNLSRYICDICLKSWRTKTLLLKHIKHHVADTRNKTVEPNAKGSKSCPICYKTMKSNSMHSHIRLVHNKSHDEICQVSVSNQN